MKFTFLGRLLLVITLWYLINGELKINGGGGGGELKIFVKFNKRGSRNLKMSLNIGNE